MTAESQSASGGAPLGTVAILGLGLIGGSLGMALRRAGAARVVGWARRAETRERALELGAVDDAADTAEAASAEADIVVLGVTVEATVPLLARIAASLGPRAVATDVGSAKARIVEEAAALLGERFVGGHPMAGSEQSGIEAASADIFPGASWVLTPTPGAPDAAVERVERMVAATGALARRCDAVEHDRLVAALSHLPHLLAYGLADTAERRIPPEWRDLAAGSFRDGTRVAASSPALWTDILLDNRSAAADALELFMDWAQTTRDALVRNDRAALLDILRRAHDARQRFPR